MKQQTIGDSRYGTQGGAFTRRAETIFAALFLLLFAVGSVGHHVAATRQLMLALTPYVLVILGLSSLVPLLIARAWRVLLWVVLSYAATFLLEAVGVATGAVFGEYMYGPTLGLKLFQVPLIIGFNWVIVVLGSVRIVEAVLDRTRLRPTVVIGPLLVGSLAVAFDLVLEPVAIALNYWQWTAVAVPFRNYAAWFVIAAVVSVPLFVIRGRPATRVTAYYVIIQLLFVASLLPLRSTDHG